MKTNYVLVLLACLGLMTACGGGEETPAASTPATTTPTSDGSQTAAELAGSYQICGQFDATAGSTYNGKAYTFNITMGSGGTYNWGLYVHSATTCGTVMNADGDNLFTFHQSGTYTVNGTNTVPSLAATKILLTPTSQTWTIYGASNAGASATAAQAFATWMNANCTGLSSNFTAGDSSRSMSGVNCTSDATTSFGNTSANGTAVKQIMYNNATYLLSGAGANWLTLGDTAYPATFGGYAAKKY